MNLRKGIFRIYIASSLPWGIFFVFLSFQHPVFSNDWLWLIGIGIGFPVIIYLVGSWISDGFFGK